MKRNLIILVLLLCAEAVFAMDTDITLETTSDYVRNAQKAGSPALLPAVNLSFDSGFAFSVNGILPFEKISLPSKRGEKTGDTSTGTSKVRYLYEMDFGGSYTYEFDPIFSVTGGIEYDWLPNYKKGNDFLINGGFLFDFILGASLMGSYSPGNKYWLISFNLSYSFDLTEDFSLGLKTGPTYYLDQKKKEFKALTNSVILTYAITESWSVGASANEAYDFPTQSSIWYFNGFVNYRF